MFRKIDSLNNYLIWWSENKIVEARPSSIYMFLWPYFEENVESTSDALIESNNQQLIFEIMVIQQIMTLYIAN